VLVSVHEILAKIIKKILAHMLVVFFSHWVAMSSW
jgi:hypothetical protein